MFKPNKLLIIDELGFVPRSQTGAELLFEVFSQRYERGKHDRDNQSAVRRMDRRSVPSVSRACITRCRIDRAVPLEKITFRLTP